MVQPLVLASCALQAEEEGGLQGWFKRLRRN
jgi:hypothetical protein